MLQHFTPDIRAAGAESSSQGHRLLVEEVSHGRLRQYRQDAQNADVLVMEDSQVGRHSVNQCC